MKPMSVAQYCAEIEREAGRRNLSADLVSSPMFLFSLEKIRIKLSIVRGEMSSGPDILVCDNMGGSSRFPIFELPDVLDRLRNISS